jgi:integrase
MSVNPAHHAHTVTELLGLAGHHIRKLHLSLKTEQAYPYRMRQFNEFHGRRHPSKLNGEDVSAYLSHLAVVERFAASTQNVALNALLYLYRNVLGVEMPVAQGAVRAWRHRRLTSVHTLGEVSRLLAELAGESHLMATLLYGSGLRLLECLELRVKDVDVDKATLTVWQGKGGKDRITMLPRTALDAGQVQLGRSRLLYEADRAA